MVTYITQGFSCISDKQQMEAFLELICFRNNQNKIDKHYYIDDTELAKIYFKQQPIH